MRKKKGRKAGEYDGDGGLGFGIFIIIIGIIIFFMTYP